MSPTNMLGDRKAQHHLLFNHFGSVLNDSPDSQTVHFPCNDQTSGSHPTLSAFCTSVTSRGMRMPSPNCQQPELSSGMELADFPSQPFPGLPHPAHLETRTRDCPSAPGHRACSLLFLPVPERKWDGEEGREGLKD